MNAPGSLRFAMITGGLLAAAPVGAITNGVPDGNAHPMVGGLFADFDNDGTISGDELVCSGSSPSVAALPTISMPMDRPD